MQYPRYVYALQNKSNGKIYVGSAFDLSNRYYKHMNLLSRNEHFSKDMQQDYNNGNVDFDLFLLDEIFCEEETNKEYQWVKRLHSSTDENGYNTITSNPRHIPVFVKHGIPNVELTKNKENKENEDSNLFDIGSAIKFYRRKKGYTLEYVAENIGTSKSTICQYEKNLRRPSFEMIALLSSILDISTECLTNPLYDQIKNTASSTYEKYKVLRDSKNLTDYQVSKDTGISTASISSWKTGRYELKTPKLKKIAYYFDVPISYFF